MKIHVFNPEHDLALAANLANFTPPHAGRQLRADLGFIPALWAGAGDVVLVLDPDEAERKFRRVAKVPFGRFVTSTALSRLPLDGVDVWGWDDAVRAFLLRCGVSERLLPTSDQIAVIRHLSHRLTAASLLPRLQGDGLVGEAAMVTSLDELSQRLALAGRLVVKAPWSSSGRGVRFLDGAMNHSDEGWLRHVLLRQGGIMVEPHYPKVKDFGMEFTIDTEGCVSYLGLSLFHTSGSAYTGNIVATEEYKMELISRYIPESLLLDIQQKLISLVSPLFRGRYQGPFGVDMMVVTHPGREGFLLHPCVEINLRRTMGHVAISLANHLPVLPRIMTIVTDNFSYKIKV